jgi:hypothetical protein
MLPCDMCCAARAPLTTCSVHQQRACATVLVATPGRASPSCLHTTWGGGLDAWDERCGLALHRQWDVPEPHQALRAGPGAMEGQGHGHERATAGASGCGRRAAASEAKGGNGGRPGRSEGCSQLGKRAARRGRRMGALDRQQCGWGAVHARQNKTAGEDQGAGQARRGVSPANSWLAPRQAISALSTPSGHRLRADAAWPRAAAREWSASPPQTSQPASGQQVLVRRTKKECEGGMPVLCKVRSGGNGHLPGGGGRGGRSQPRPVKC